MIKFKKRNILIVLALLFVFSVLMNALYIFAKPLTVSADVNTLSSNIAMDDNFEDDCVLVVLDESISLYKAIPQNISKSLFDVGAKEITNLSALPDKYLHSDGSINVVVAPDLAEYYNENAFNQILRVELETKGKQYVLDAIEKIAQIDGIASVEPNRIVSSGDATTDDPYLSDQWSLVDPKGINISGAWDITTGDKNILVGVIDSGISNHSDLNANVTTGYDFYHNNSITTDNIGGHGTHVAGIIGAVGNNGTGVSGVAQNVTLVPLQTAYDTSGSGSHHTEDIIEAINYARNLWETDQRISILNYSISGFGEATTVLNAIKNFPGLFVWGAGNNGEDVDTYANSSESNLPNLISVGSIDSNGKRSEFSNYGAKSVSIFAPGGSILSTYPTSLCTSGSCTKSTHYANGYHYMSGTSMAAPHVTGVAALMLSKNPNLTAAELKKAILENADDIEISIPGSSVPQKVKKLNAYEALASLEKESYTVTLHYNDGYGDYTEKVSVAYGETMPTSGWANAPKRAGYEFVGYYSEENGNGTQYYSMVLKTGPHHMWDYYYYEGLNPVSTWDHFRDGDLYAHWKLLECEYIYENVILNEGNLAQSTVHLKHGINEIEASPIDGYSFSYFYNFKDNKEYPYSTVEWNIELIRDESTGNVIPKYAFYAVYKEKNCIAEGTLITLANGEQVPVEQLTGDEMLLVWNLHTGTFDTAPILCIDSDPQGIYEVINLYFSDGTQVKVISEHAFWDFDLNKYVYLDKDASEYIGHWFNKQIASENGEFFWTSVQLTDVIIQEEYTAAYSPVTYGHLCYYVDGMLSMPGGISGLFNIFEVDSNTMSYDFESMQNDIEQYGLFSYEDFAEILPVAREVFEAVNGQYLKVAIGKGLIDLDTIASYINEYSALFS